MAERIDRFPPCAYHRDGIGALASNGAADRRGNGAEALSGSLCGREAIRLPLRRPKTEAAAKRGGTNNFAYVSALNDLARAHQALGRYAEAAAMFKQVLGTLQKMSGAWSSPPSHSRYRPSRPRHPPQPRSASSIPPEIARRIITSRTFSRTRVIRDRVEPANQGRARSSVLDPPSGDTPTARAPVVPLPTAGALLSPIGLRPAGPSAAYLSAALTTCTRRFSAAKGLAGSLSCLRPYPTVTRLPASIPYFSLRNCFTASARRSDRP
jgi:hypothetical protein